MNLPKVLAELVKAQDHYDSDAYANCFSEIAVVFDEGNTYNGRMEIKQWIAEANEKFKIVMKPVGFSETKTASVLTAEISGSFDGSPVLLDYHFEITDDKIDGLTVTINTMR